MEKWKQVPIADYKDLYKVSDKGRVYSVRNKRCLVPKTSKAGYYRVSLSCHGKTKLTSIHRLVALAFIPNPENKPTVNHINEIKMDNRVENLEWATNKEQNIHGTRLERARAHTDYRARKIDYSVVASKHDYVKLAKINSHPIKAWSISGNELMFVGEFPSQRIASDYTGVSQSKISQCVSGQKKSCKGYIFKSC